MIRKIRMKHIKLKDDIYINCNEGFGLFTKMKREEENFHLKVYNWPYNKEKKKKKKSEKNYICNSSSFLFNDIKKFMISILR